MKKISRQVVGIIFGCFVILNTKTSGELRRIIPSEIDIREGEDMQLRLSSILSDETSCYVRTPLLQNINLKIDEDEDDRVKFWSENNSCGVKVKNVRQEDQGFWRLVSENGSNKKLVDAVNVKVLDKVNSIENQYQIKNGLGYNLLFAHDSKFCTVQRPNDGITTTEIIEEDCVVDLKEPTQADVGNWTAKVGIKGQIEEVESTVKLTVYEERIMSGYQKHGNKYLHVYCNLLNYDWVPDLCRFSQPERHQNAFRMSDGLKKERYGYYGNGLAKGQCGLTIENPTPEDFVTWHCRVGKVGKRILGDYIRIPIQSRKSEDVIFESVSPAITTTSKNLILQCSVNIPLKYCWFSGPNGTFLTPTESNPADFPNDAVVLNSYSYFGKGLNTGECGVNIKSAEEVHNGIWTCHMGPNSPGREITVNIVVRISETPLAARSKVVFAENNGDPVSIKCETVPNRVALQYCRFLSPTGIGIHIDEKITKENPLVFGTTKIWFNGKSKKLGECGVTLQDISSQDIGTWRCAARLEAVKLVDEAFDTIEIILKDQNETENLTAAASAEIAVGLIILLGLIVGTIIFVNKQIRGNWVPRRARHLSSAEETPRGTVGEQIPSIALNPISQRSSATTSESDR